MLSRKEHELLRFRIGSERTLAERLRRRNYLLSRRGGRTIVRKIPDRSRIIDYFKKKTFPLERLKSYHDNLKFIVPDTFSILDEPHDTLRSIYAFMRKLLRYKKVNSISVIYEGTKHFDLSAEIIFDCLLSEAISVYEKKADVFGNYPQGDKWRRFIKSMGIIEELDIKHEMLKKQELDELRVFKESSRKTASKTTDKGKNYFDEVTMKFIDHINACLAHLKKRLSDGARSNLSQYVSEILDNIFEHSGMDLWTMAGYLDTKDKDLTCEVAIFNFGDTFCESFDKMDRSSPTSTNLAKYIGLHGKKFTRENLTTVYSLQGNVSSKNTSVDATRGMGTIEFIKFFEGIHTELQQSYHTDYESKMAILSGSTCISIDKHCRLQQESAESSRRIIPFNSSGSLYDPPDKHYVQHMEDIHFPGTIIAIRFNLSKSMTTEVQQ